MSDVFTLGSTATISIRVLSTGHVELNFPGVGKGSDKRLTLKQAQALVKAVGFRADLETFLANAEDQIADTKLVYEQAIAELMVSEEGRAYRKEKGCTEHGVRMWAMAKHAKGQKAANKQAKPKKLAVEELVKDPEQMQRVAAAKARLAELLTASKVVSAEEAD